MTSKTESRNNADWEPFDEFEALEESPEETLYYDTPDEDDE